MAQPQAPYFSLHDDLLARLARNATPRAFPRNAIVVNEGDRSASLYVVQSGRVKVFLANENGREVVLSIAGPGEYFGEMTLDGGPRSASVATLEPSKLLMIPGADVRRMLSENPEFAAHLINKLIHRVRVLTDTVRSLALQDVYSRFVRFVHEFATPGEDGQSRVEERLTQQIIADRIGASREMVSRILKDLVAGGYVTFQRGRLVVEKRLPEHW